MATLGRAFAVLRSQRCNLGRANLRWRVHARHRGQPSSALAQSPARARCRL